MDGEEQDEPTVGIETVLAAVSAPIGSSVAGSDRHTPFAKQTGKKRTAQRAVRLLEQAGLGYVEPSREERRALSVGFAMAGKVLYGAAYDVVRLSREVDLANPQAIAEDLKAITICEIKSSNRMEIADDFTGYFFDLTTAELLVAQSLGEQYHFAFVNTVTGAHLELGLTELFARARKIYPKWAVRF